MTTNGAAGLVTGLLVSGDLIFTTKVRGTAEQLGYGMRTTASPAAATEQLRAEPVRCVLLDLGLQALTADLIREIVKAAAQSPVIAFGSHVDTERLEAAREAGCTEVLPRSRFSSELPDLLRIHMGPRS